MSIYIGTNCFSLLYQSKVVERIGALSLNLRAASELAQTRGQDPEQPLFKTLPTTMFGKQNHDLVYLKQSQYMLSQIPFPDSIYLTVRNFFVGANFRKKCHKRLQKIFLQFIFSRHSLKWKPHLQAARIVHCVHIVCMHMAVLSGLLKAFMGFYFHGS